MRASTGRTAHWAVDQGSFGPSLSKSDAQATFAKLTLVRRKRRLMSGTAAHAAEQFNVRRSYYRH